MKSLKIYKLANYQERNYSYGQNKITCIITLPDVETGRGKEQPDARQELCCCIDGSAQIFP